MQEWLVAQGIDETKAGDTVGKPTAGLRPACPPAPSGANKKSFPRGAPMQHLAPRRNPEG